MDQIWPYVLSLIGVFGIWLAGSKNVLGWWVGFMAQWLWVIFALQTEQYGFLISAVAYGSVYARNYILWKRENEHGRTNGRDKRT